LQDDQAVGWRKYVGVCVAAARASIRGLDAAIMPRCCVFCGAECEPTEGYFCDGCAEDLPWNENQCARCAQPIVAAMPAGRNCADCLQRPQPFVAAAAPLKYEFPIDAAIRALKFHRRLDYVPAFGAILTAVMPSLPADIDALLPVPLHWRRHAMRGFNQATELCAPVAKATGLPIVRNARRARSTPYQSGLNARERRRNLRSAFAIQGALEGSHVLIVDDVITTGETCRQLAHVLRRSGVRQVSVLAVARASQGPKRD